MSVVSDSPVHSSSSGDDFAAFLDAELDSTSDTSPEPGDDDDENENDYDSELFSTKKQKVELSDNVVVSYGSTSRGAEEKLVASIKEDICTHPGVIGGMCIRCGQKTEEGQSGVAFGYIHKDLRLANDEIARLRNNDLKNLFRHKKLNLVLDLDHTLLNSSQFRHITPEEEYLRVPPDSLPDELKGNLFRLDFMHMMTKLRPFVRTFLKEASKLFEMYIYTMGERAYALEMARLLDPENIYFNSKVIAQGDCTQRHQKGLDVVVGQDSAVLILDDTEQVWSKHKENLILMERYHYFVSSYRQFRFNCKSRSELKCDESEDDGALAAVLEVLKRVHSIFFDTEQGGDINKKDVRQVLKTVRKEVLKDCKLLFTKVIPIEYRAESHHFWKMAEQLGATCSTEMDPSVTHVVSLDKGTEKSRWAVRENKFLVHPSWIEAANYLWRKHPEEKFPVDEVKQTK
ncbi:RNA polymerase II C-terminal domain phosphatase-like 4 isoform X1 [Apium graveolens]|uniref:RNA polymerase II C-terminal domain phosphatase-like 4 isoform X1 n=1 Tax=Apium graveolens TaxID=4045 RepID=UPI003D7A8ECA